MVTTVSGSVDRTVELRGMRFHYVEWGQPGAPPVVLLHGLTGHARIWDHTASRLADRFRLYALDQRGHGDTAWPEPPSYETDDFVEDTLAFVDHLRLERFALAGLSMGGHNAMAFAARYPERVTKLIIVDIMPALRMDRSPNWPEMERIARQGHIRFQNEDQAFAAARLGNPHAPDENLRYRVALNLKPAEDGRLVWKYDHRAPVLWRPADLWAEVERITMPALLVRGAKALAQKRTMSPLRRRYSSVERRPKSCQRTSLNGWRERFRTFVWSPSRARGTPSQRTGPRSWRMR